MKKYKSPEQAIKNEILEWLTSHGAFVWPTHSVGIFDPVKKIYRKNNSKHHRQGVADIIGIWEGKPLAIEVKSKTGTLSEHQIIFLRDFAKNGGIGFMARSLEDVKWCLNV